MPTTALQKPDAKSRAYVLQRIAAEAKKRLHKNSVGLMSETINPLWNINERQAQLVYDFARSGNYAQIQYLYNEIEERDPTLLVCVTRRTSAVAELDWRVVRSDERLNRNADKALIQEQIKCVETAIAKIDNMPDALEHLALSSFRGFSIVAPVHNIAGDARHLDLIDTWNMCYDRQGQSWYFNPTASSFMMPTSEIGRNSFKGLEYVPPEQICAVVRKRQIDWPAMQIYLRLAIGERDWGRFLETYGLPPVIITMPEFTSKEEQEAYVQAAESVFKGRSGVVPYGSNVSYGSESRGTNPFTEFIEHQQKLVVMMATGGTLASLAESTGLGNGASDVQQDEWNRIIRADKRIISNAINKQICEPILRNCKDFKGKPILAEFQLDDTPKPTPKEMLELAGAASSAGFEMDAEELSQACGFTLRKKAEGGFGMNAEAPTQTVTIPDCPDRPDGGDAETVRNVDEGADVLNANGRSIVSKMNKLIAEDDRNGTGKALAYWGKLTLDEWDDAIRHVMGRLPKGGYNKSRISSIIEKSLGIMAAMRFDGLWKQYYNWFMTREPERFYAPTTHGLDGFTVKNDETAALPPVAPPAQPEAVGNAAGAQAEGTPQKAATAASDAASDIAAALQTDFKGVAERIGEILRLPEAERAAAAQRLIVELPSLVPDDPAMAEVIGEQMKAAFKEQLGKSTGGNAPATNKNTKG